MHWKGPKQYVMVTTKQFTLLNEQKSTTQRESREGGKCIWQQGIEGMANDTRGGAGKAPQDNFDTPGVWHGYGPLEYLSMTCGSSVSLVCPHSRLWGWRVGSFNC
jgi:hypothetical protein